MKKIFFFFTLFLIIISCSHHADSDKSIKIRIPAGFPEINYPADNLPTKLRVELGRKLFYDNRLSEDQTVNCSSCHVPSAAFTDGRTTSTGMSGSSGRRNAPTLANVAWLPYYMMEGGVRTLELQSLAPLHDSIEMGFNVMHIIDRLNRDEQIRNLSKLAYNRDAFDAYVLTRSLSAFQRSIISGDTPYDRYFTQHQNDALSEEEKRGMDLFFSERTQCSSCHAGIFFSDFGFHNIGLSESYQDPGKERENYKKEDNGKFKTPTLRNIALTGPYMHDGSISSLEEVLLFYNGGGKNHPNKDSRIKPLNLTPSEQADLLAFMKALTDWNFVQNKNLFPPE
jgi:cytochrome c peroxidase